MMFIDSSALLAILVSDPIAPNLVSRLQGARRKPLTSALARTEVVTDLAQRRAAQDHRSLTGDDIALATEAYDELLRLLECSEIMVTTKIGNLAIEALGQFSSMSGHRAQLTQNECIIYASAKTSSMPLLYVPQKGRGYGETDLA